MTGFRKATKTEAKLRMAIIGPSGSGKTWTSLTIATSLGERVAVIDTERGSASKYADQFEFDVLELQEFSPESYIEAIKLAESEGYDVLVIDSLSHEWAGKGGALELVDQAAAKSKSKNSFNAWGKVTPRHQAMVEAMLSCGCHVIGTMRTKTHYVLETNERGKQEPRKVGMKPIQRDEVEYEFDVVAAMDHDHRFVVEKSRCPALSDEVIDNPDRKVADTLKLWLAGEKDGRSELKAAMRELNKKWPDVVGFASELLDRADFKERPLTNGESLSLATALRRERAQFDQRDAEPLPDEDHGREEAVELLARTRADLDVTPQKAGVIAKNHFGRSTGELNAAELRELCTVIEKELARD